MMRRLQLLLLLPLAFVPALVAQKHTGTTLRVDDQRAPRGGRALVRVWLTEPKPIILGYTRLQFDPAVLSSLAGAAALSDSANVMGVGTFNLAARSVQTRFTSTDQNFGTNAALPLLVVALDVNPNAPSASSQLTLDIANTSLMDLASQPLPAPEVKPGTFTVGGVSINEVSPPSGNVPAGTQIVARGKGFQPGATLSIVGVTTGATQFVSESELRVTAQQTFAIEGKQINVGNPDGSSNQFFAITPAPAQPSADPLLSRTVPFFSRVTFTSAQVTYPNALAPGTRALAFQNPDSDGGQVSVTLFSASGQRLGQGTVQIAQRGIPVMRSLAELAPGVTDAQVRTASIVSDMPIRVLGLQTDPAAGGVNPIPAVAAAAPVVPQINAGGVTNAVSYRAGLAAGSIVAIFGRNFAASEAYAASLPLPVTLGGVKVTIGGKDAPLYYAGPTQINAQVPWDVPAGPVSVVVTSATGASVPFSMSATLESPGLASRDSSGSGPGAIADALTGEPVTAANPISRGGILTIYCLGLGPVSNTPATGAVALADPLSKTVTDPVVTIGGVPAAVLFAGLSPGSVSLYQVNVQVPDAAPSGAAVEVRLTMNGTASNAVTVAVQ